MLNTKRFLQTNDDWEDREESDKTWANWKAVYKKANPKVHKSTGQQRLCQVWRGEFIRKTRNHTRCGNKPRC